MASWVTAIVVLAGVARWIGASWTLRDPCSAAGGVAGCVAPPIGLRYLQFGIAVSGVAAGLVGVVYAVHLGLTGRTFRRWRGVAISFAGLVAAWLAVYLVGMAWLWFNGT
jgi:hypothetical protein